MQTSIRSLDAAAVDRQIGSFEKKTNIELAPSQRDAVSRALNEKVVVITGGPGVGKTTIVRAIVQIALEARLSVLLAAPTGRAAP